MIKGIDVSNWQGNVDFNKVKNAGYEIAYIKATEGQHTLDKNFNTNYANAKVSGINIGFYHFLHGNENGKTQAEWMYSNIKDKEFQCKIAIDVEVTDGANADTLSQIVCDFAETIKSLTGKEVVLYTYTSFLGANLNSSIDKYPLWIAEYGVNKPNISRNYIGWQYADNGQVDGCPNGNTDLDYFTEEIYIANSMPNTSNQDVKPINKVGTNFAVGENVRIIADRYSTGQIIPTWVKKSSYPIIQVGEGKCLLGNGLDSWVDNNGLEPVRAFSVGDKVKVIGSNYATGQAIPEWVKSNIYTIQELTNTEALLKEIESWVYLTDLVKSNIVVGAKVRIKSSATNYVTGESIPNWVKENIYTVEQITDNKALLKEIESWLYLNDLQEY
ncbi:GH25 family lysozyme [Clostridium sp.]|uniref:GH25 family lysozyme n=1 Tax=Clostridium sp. TaxID=1506 RepID=UPI0039965CC3